MQNKPRHDRIECRAFSERKVDAEMIQQFEWVFGTESPLAIYMRVFKHRPESDAYDYVFLSDLNSLREDVRRKFHELFMANDLAVTYLYHSRSFSAYQTLQRHIFGIFYNALLPVLRAKAKAKRKELKN